MRFWFAVLCKLVAFALTVPGCLILGIAAVPEPGTTGFDRTVRVVIAAILLGLALGLHLLGRWMMPKDPEPAKPEPLPFAPEPGEGWRPQPDWARLPDPLPDRPPAFGMELRLYPNAPVPPDEIVRRLWLVRAHLVQLRGTGFVPPRVFLNCLAFGMVGMLTGIMIAFVVTADAEVWYRAWMAFAAIPFAWLSLGLLWTILKDYGQGLRRRSALYREERRLAVLDADRPGGPRGGPNLGTRSDEHPGGYTPPVLAPENT